MDSTETYKSLDRSIPRGWKNWWTGRENDRQIYYSRSYCRKVGRLRVGNFVCLCDRDIDTVARNRRIPALVVDGNPTRLYNLLHGEFLIIYFFRFLLTWLRLVLSARSLRVSGTVLLQFGRSFTSVYAFSQVDGEFKLAWTTRVRQGTRWNILLLHNLRKNVALTTVRPLNF